MAQVKDFCELALWNKTGAHGRVNFVLWFSKTFTPVPEWGVSIGGNRLSVLGIQFH
jgi:hypothetical protein